MWTDITEQVVDLASPADVAEVRAFLQPFGLTFDGNVDYTIALYKNYRMVATGSLAGNVLRNIAVEGLLQGEGLTATVVSRLMAEAARRGRHHYFIYTKPENAHLFAALGFKEIATAAGFATLLETGMGSIEASCREMARQLVNLPVGPRACLVVNCNPFTLGHKAVIAKAAEENCSVVVLVVSEDRSLFPFDVRLKLVREGLKDFNNIAVLPAGKYLISAATFPDYFTRGEQAVLAQTRLDATVFGRHIAPALGVTSRYVGEEPYCAVTLAYNRALAEILPSYGIAVRIMPRLAVDDQIISASNVREMIRKDEWEQIRRLVPDTTFNYLISAQAAPVIAKIKQSLSRH